jgi:AcrR family transcriptional regulator
VNRHLASPVDERKAQRRAAIVAMATRLFTRDGYDATSVNDVADALQMSVGGLYRYIDTKSDLLTLVCEDIYGTLADSLDSLASAPGDAAAKLLDATAVYLRACAENRSLILLMYREYRHLPPAAQHRYREREREIAEIFRRLVTSLRESRGERPDEPRAELLALDIVLLGHAPAVKGWSLQQDGLDIEATLSEQLKAIGRMVD